MIVAMQTERLETLAPSFRLICHWKTLFLLRVAPTAYMLSCYGA